MCMNEAIVRTDPSNTIKRRLGPETFVAKTKDGRELVHEKSLKAIEAEMVSRQKQDLILSIPMDMISSKQNQQEHIGDINAFKCFVKGYKHKDKYSQFIFAKYLIHLSIKVKNNNGPDSHILEINELNHSYFFDMTGFENMLWAKKSNINNLSDYLRYGGVKWIQRLADTQICLGKPPLVDAQLFYGDCCTRGLYGVEKNPAHGFRYFLYASKQGNPYATYKVGYGYENGFGVKKDPKRSLQFYRKAAFSGNLYAMHRLAIVLQEGQLNQRKSPREALTWMKRAAAAADISYPQPIHDLALFYEKNGSPAAITDEAYAYQLFKKSASYGYSPSQYKLGVCFEYGLLGQKVDYAVAISWYFRAANNGNSYAELAISGWYLSGYEDVIEQNDIEAFRWAERPAKNGFDKGEFALGYYYEKGIGCTMDIEASLYWYTKAAKQGNKRAIIRKKELKKQLRRQVRTCFLF